MKTFEVYKNGELIKKMEVENEGINAYVDLTWEMDELRDRYEGCIINEGRTRHSIWYFVATNVDTMTSDTYMYCECN